MRLSPGDVVAERFEIRRQAGAGGMSLVYAARDRTTGGPVALKILDGDRASVSRFVRETRVLSELHHPAIVAYVAHGAFADSTPWLAMEWLEGEDLSERLARAPLSTAEAIALTARVAEALAAAHARGVVHRDVKPSNLFLPGGAIDRVKVLDFGIARVSFGDQTQTNSRIGTPAYMSPEQARGTPPPSPASDVFALGVVLHQSLTGQRPFTGDDSMAVIARILLADPPHVREARPEIPVELDALVWRMLAKDPLQRPGDGGAVATALAAIAQLTTTGGGDAPTLGAGEHRLTCLILARDVPAELVPAIERAAAGFGARVEPMADGTVALLLGGAGVATDLTAQGARCALAVRAIAPGAIMALVTGRVISTSHATVGEVIDRAVAVLRTPGTAASVTRSTQRDRPPMGSPFDSFGTTMASGLLDDVTTPNPRLDDDATAPILLDDVTAGLLDARFELEGSGRHLALRGEREASDATRTLLGKPTLFVARDAELATLEASYAACVDEPAPRVVLITAPPGVGKSRLRQELLRRLALRTPAPEVLLGRADPTSAGAPFGVLADAIRRATGLRDGEALEVRRHKLRARVGRPRAGDDAERVAEFLGEVIGTPFLADDRVELAAARADARLMSDQIRRAIEDWLAAEARARPLVLVLEDLHWGDAPTAETVDAALRNLADLPLFVVATARPELHEHLPGLWIERGLVEIRLPELGKKAAEKLVAAALGAAASPERIAWVVERAGGNALWLEELVRAAAEGKDDASPSTLVAMVQARLERMEPDARRMLRAAAVFGETFWAGGVAALTDERGTLAPWLDALIQREVIVRRGAGRIRGEVEYAFRHALVRDAAYAMLTPDDRALGHRLAAAWLESSGDRDPVRLAEHHERGGAPEQALTWWLRAAEKALAACDLAAVLAHVDHALACGAAGPTLGTLRLVAAEAHEWRGEFALAARTAREAMRWLPTGDAMWFAAVGVCATALGVQGQAGELEALSNELDGVIRDDLGVFDLNRVAVAGARLIEQLIITGHLVRADRLLGTLERAASARPRGPAVAARLHAAVALRARYAGDVAANLLAVDAAIAACHAAGDRRGLCVHQERLGYARLELGDAAGAEAALRYALAGALPLGLRNVVATARHNLGLALSRLGRHREALEVETEALAAFTASGNRRMRGAALEYLALIHLAAGDVVEAERAAREAVRVASVAPALPLNQAESWAILARALLAQALAEEALDVADRGLALLERLGGIDDGESIIRLTHAEALAAAGRQREAHEALARARQRVLERAARIGDPELRAGFLAGVPENRRTLELADAWLAPTGP